VFVGLGAGFAAKEFYALADRLLAGQDPCAAERARLALVREQRQKALDGWFEAHAADWDLMTALEGKAAGVENAIAEAARRGGVGRLLDIGTGTGRMLELLAPEAVSATGVDRSPEMLRVARAKVGTIDAAHVDVRSGDMRALPFPRESFDTVVLHQVLHFTDDPAAAVAEAARLVAPGGKLLVADYAPHEREELRDRFQHLRLGFETADVCRWLEAGGLKASERSRHPGPELTTVLWEGRR
jgi:ArsR family transcriptional regulator